jgi:hypothetical protein
VGHFFHKHPTQRRRGTTRTDTNILDLFRNSGKCDIKEAEERDMKYERVKELNGKEFRRSTGVKPATFEKTVTLL